MAFRATAISGSLTRTTTGDTLLIAGSDITIVTGSDGRITINATGGGGSSQWTLNSTNLYPNLASTTVLVGGNSTASADILLGAAGAAIFNEQNGSQDFKVKTAGKDNALLIKGASNQVLIHSGGAGASPHEAAGADVAFYVSGSSTGRSFTASRGVSLFGGDTVISGSLTVFNSGSDAGGTISGSVHHTSGGLSYLVAGDNVTVVSSSNGQVTISAPSGPSNLMKTFSLSGDSGSSQTISDGDTLDIEGGTGMITATGTDKVIVSLDYDGADSFYNGSNKWNGNYS